MMAAVVSLWPTFLTTGLQSVFVSSAQSVFTLSTQDADIGIDNYIAVETPIALSNILCNIGPSGNCVPDVSAGLVIASPSRANPDYFYSWTRDAALTFKCLVDSFIDKYDPSLQIQIEDYISAQAQLQTLPNPSGDLESGAGLGEPKFNADATPFTASWGRPQRDGPALRATALITYSKWLLNYGYNATAQDIIWPIIQNDLSYVAQYWNETGFDLWEEVLGSSFFTISAQHRALVEGSNLAAALGKSCSFCDSQAPQLLCFLQSFWDPTKGYIQANINDRAGRSAKDSSSILGSIHQFDPSIGCDDKTFQPCSDKALASHKVITDSFRSVYSINAGIPQGKAVSVGRYPEDVYYDGHPWYLSTLAAAEQLYDALYVWKKSKAISVTDISLAFFRDFFPSIQTGTYDSTSPQYKSIIDAVFSYADGYMKVVATHTQSNGSLSEQFNKVTGEPLSAYDLTWSYAAFITASTRRSGVVPSPWTTDKKGVFRDALPFICVAKPEKGKYVAAPTFTWPASQTPPGYTPNPTTTSRVVASCTPAPSLLVSFKVLASTVYGDTIKISGSTSNLGKWELHDAFSMSAHDYTVNFPVWQGTVRLASGSILRYKYIKVNSSGAVDWEEGHDRMLEVPHSCKTAISVIDKWESGETHTSI